MNRYRWWHVLKGHGAPKTVPWDATSFDREMQVKGYEKDFIAKLIPVAATQVVTRCSCGDEWVFDAMIFAETYIPGGGALNFPDLRPRNARR